VKLILVLAIVFSEILFVDLFQVTQIIGTLGVNTFVDYEVFTVFLRHKRMHAVRTTKIQGRRTILFGGEFSLAYLAHKLSLGTVILVKKGFGSIATRTFTAVTNVALRAAIDRFYGLISITITPLVVGCQVSIIPWLYF
jgi:hypothetical protein